MSIVQEPGRLEPVMSLGTGEPVMSLGTGAPVERVAAPRRTDPARVELNRPWPEVSSETTWLPELPVAVRVDRPADGRAVGALVIVPPFGQERVVAFRTLRVLALQAARHGFVVVSPDLPGDGDSPAPAEAPFPAQWPAAAEAAVRYARAAVPGRPVHAIGLRVGACIAAALPGYRRERRILWEPISGQEAAQRLRRMRRRAIDVPLVDGGDELAGRLLTPAEVAAFEALTLPAEPAPAAAAPQGPEQVVRVESDRAAAALLATCPPHVAAVPYGWIADLVESLPTGAATPVGELPVRATALVAPGVEETLMVLGPRRCRAVLTRAIRHDATASGGDPVAVLAFTATGTELATGPGDLWAAQARRRAPYGVVSIRADRSGLGDSLDPDVASGVVPYTEEAAQDCADLIRAARRVAGAAPVLAVGVCAGPWCLMRGAELAPPTAILSVNQAHWAPESWYYDDDVVARWHGTSKGPAVAAAPRRESPLVVVRRAALTRLPQLALLRHPKDARDRVGRMLRRVPREVSLYLVTGGWESVLFRAKGGGWHGRGRRPRLRWTVEPILDHGAVAARSRHIVAGHIDAVLADWGLLTSPPEGVPERGPGTSGVRQGRGGADQ
ncbi:MAG: hypothetical protein LCH98_17610 [Actinobacteria bacterium]|nr:hypothetical protein [Actinomycetota bacterium]